MTQIAGWIYATDGTAFSLEKDSSGKTWLISADEERICEMSLETFKELERDVIHTVRYPKLDSLLVKKAIRQLKSI
ncbi:hypothetical protein CTM93_18820 [Photobacterium phosphoreum]|uniref:hypothetical protein n=1 Tax=Photobacterium TaxID=657 RepID=UPI000D186CDC|nr:MULTISPECIES: hypothetical protein [Photobacterium]MCD9465427.1 hypothetical protein [Photobacterium phosphoreum]MCD9481473.1 hypothetical protein [Photobacterium phosphoreum]MEC6814954.1 hypothetical protein [Photobacterium toruni]PSU77696.1 hypothetical protein CTM93_18820 [Photobacterium phosphoreum]